MFLGTILLLYFAEQSSCLTYSPEVTVYELLYGDLTKVENFFVLSNNTDEPEIPEEPKKKNHIIQLLEKLENMNHMFPMDCLEGEDLNEIGRSITNLTRRQRVSQSWERQWYDYDYDDYYDVKRKVTERRKKSMLVMINLQFLIHTRFKIREAMAFRRIVTRDKRYKLGYLFNRMRKLALEQRKVAAAGEENRIEKSDLHSLYTMMRMYEKVVRYDVDMRDCAAAIKTVYAERASVDKLY